MEYFLTEEQKVLKGLARRIAEERILPVRAELDEKEEFPRAIMKDLADSDLFRICVPEEYDGLGGGCLDLCLVVEELSRICSGVAVSYAATGLGASALLEYGSDEQKQKYLPDIAAGKKLAAFALTESTAGSDASNIKTTAEKRADGYVLNGTKQFITNGGDAEIYTTLSTANNTESDVNWTVHASDSYTTTSRHNIYRSGVIDLSSKTSYYLNMKHTESSGIINITFFGDRSPTTVRAVCAYL